MEFWSRQWAHFIKRTTKNASQLLAAADKMIEWFGKFQALLRVLADLTFARYLATGFTLFIIDMASFLMCVHTLELSIEVAQVFGRALGAGIGFLAHRFISFRSDVKPSVFSLTAQGSGYVVLVLLNIAISPFVVRTAVALIGGNLVLGKVIAEVFLVCETYLLLRSLFYSTRKET